ncbi:DUF1294 domain-containing protein [Sphingobium sp. AP49]|uniref:DUF1294 domain-containing protein n=1 Tax=Sphingobium sp. AP49 TaxID=1144307 RepID=UPI00026EDFD1|nr:DUF1294 domain-containing protein [Sphingobium sp. AP49]WHO38834.1 DUF1294 domain-containing protein [Sphingobium sp. AP49]
MLIILTILFLAINAWTMLMFRFDKRQAIAGERRVAEADLLMLAFIGGTPGAFAARQMFRHKTRKEPFSTRLMVIAVVQIGALIGWFLF